MRKDQANTMPPSDSSLGEKANGKRSDIADIEDEGGDVPNDSITWSVNAFDRMNGSIKGKNRPQNIDNDISVHSNTGKQVTTQLK
jgi:hypothetical protein